MTASRSPLARTAASGNRSRWRLIGRPSSSKCVNRPSAHLTTLATRARRLRAAVAEALRAGHPGLGALVGTWPVDGPDEAARAVAELAAFAVLGGAPTGNAALLPQIIPLRGDPPASGEDILGQTVAALGAITDPPELVEAIADLLATRPAPGPVTAADHERLLALLDSAHRRRHGAFYTPAALVRAQVRWAGQLAAQSGFGQQLAEPGVVTIDPAMGTGTYLLEVSRQAPGRVVGRELMPGPFAVATALLTGLAGADLAWGNALGETLASDDRFRTCLGNPPWARGGEGDSAHRPELLSPLVQFAVETGQGGAVKNLYNSYVEFWAWALREVFERRPGRPGVICFVTPSSFLTGAAFVGLRARLRRECDAIWVVDLGGEGRGGRTDPNVFEIQTPAAITVAWRRGTVCPETPAVGWYRQLTGSRATKLAALDHLTTLSGDGWLRLPAEASAPLCPAAPEAFGNWPALAALFPWRHSGVQPKRTWPVAPDPETLARRWAALLQAADRGEAMRQSPDRRADRAYPSQPAGGPAAPPLADLPPTTPPPPTLPYAWRSFDRQWLLADGRLLSRPRPALWAAHSPRQRYFCTSLSQPLGVGPALTITAAIPDLHVFCGRGARDILPWYLDREATRPNLPAPLLPALAAQYGRTVTAEEWWGYVFGVLAQPGYARRFEAALARSAPHLPMTADAARFGALSAAGAALARLQVVGAETGRAQLVQPVPADPASHPAEFRYEPATGQLTLGAGVISEVAPEVMAFEVSGLRPVASWLGYRLAVPRGRRSAPLDQTVRRGWPPVWTAELLQLLWTLEATLASYPHLDRLLGEILAGPLLSTEVLWGPSEGRR